MYSEYGIKKNGVLTENQISEKSTMFYLNTPYMLVSEVDDDVNQLSVSVFFFAFSWISSNLLIFTFSRPLRSKTIGIWPFISID